MKKINAAVFAALLILLTASCRKDSLQGTGTNGTRTFTLPAFTGVETHFAIEAIISQGPVQQVTVTGYENLLNELEPEVENGILKLRYREPYRQVTNDNLVATIIVPAINSATIHGSNDINISGFANGTTLHTKIHGSGSVTVTGSRYQKAKLEIYGSGETDAGGMLVSEAEAAIHGSGHIRIAVTEKLKAGIFGSGNIYYWGDPVLETTVQGSGRVLKR